jgi:hypothetical protein
MTITTLEKLVICGQALSRPTFVNRYRFWRCVEGYGPMRSALLAAIATLRRGERG